LAGILALMEAASFVEFTKQRYSAQQETASKKLKNTTA